MARDAVGKVRGQGAQLRPGRGVELIRGDLVTDPQPGLVVAVTGRAQAGPGCSGLTARIRRPLPAGPRRPPTGTRRWPAGPARPRCGTTRGRRPGSRPRTRRTTAPSRRPRTRRTAASSRRPRTRRTTAPGRRPGTPPGPRRSVRPRVRPPRPGRFGRVSPCAGGVAVRAAGPPPARSCIWAAPVGIRTAPASIWAALAGIRAAPARHPGGRAGPASGRPRLASGRPRPASGRPWLASGRPRPASGRPSAGVRASSGQRPGGPGLASGRPRPAVGRPPDPRGCLFPEAPDADGRPARGGLRPRPPRCSPGTFRPPARTRRPLHLIESRKSIEPRKCVEGRAPAGGDPQRKMSGGVLLSHAVPRAVPSALKGLTSGFGMGPGISPSL